MDKYDDYLYSLAEQVYEESKEVNEEEHTEDWGADPDMVEFPF